MIIFLGSISAILDDLNFDTVQIQSLANSFDPLPTMERWDIAMIIFTRTSVSDFSPSLIH
jgi:hypothetical protein